MRKCFLHIGRHKTGSSAIQWALHHYRDELERRGYLYPKAGIPPEAAAHYDIAWELRADAPRERQPGTIDGLVTEINASTHHVVISCEDFSIAIQSLDEFQAFIARLSNCGLAVVVVCYVRSPHDYLRSAFLELLKTGFPFGFTGFATAVLDDELVTWKDHSAIGRDRVVESLLALSERGDARVVVRSYDTVPKTVVADFFSLIGLTLADFSRDEEPRRNEANATEQAFSLFFRNVAGRDPDHREQALIAAVGATAPMHTLHMSEPAWRLIARKYQPDLQILASRFGVELANPGSTPNGMAGHPRLEEVFSETMVRSIQAAACLLAETADDQDRAYQEVVAHYRAAMAARDALASERDQFTAERDRAFRDLVAHYTAAIGERDALAAERDALAAERDALAAERDAIAAERDRAYNEVVAHYKAAIGARDRLNVLHEELSLTLDTVLKSRSWRMTAPLRSILSRFGKRGR